MDDSRIKISKTELATAIKVWIICAPKRIWRDYWHHAETEAKWGGTSGIARFDPREAMAEHLAGKFAQANWEITYPTPRHPDGGASLVHHRDLAEQRRIDSEGSTG